MKPTINLDNCQFKLAKGYNQKSLFAELALKNHLYVNGWILKNELNLICFADNCKIGLCFYNNNSIGIVYVRNNIVMTYVKPIYRHSGIGSKLIELTNSKNKKLKCGIGNKASVPFYKKFNFEIIPVYEFMLD